MKPTIGRIVHYVTEEFDPATHKPNAIAPAMIVTVWKGESVALTVFLQGDQIDVRRSHQATSPAEAKPGEWFEPPRVQA